MTQVTQTYYQIVKKHPVFQLKFEVFNGYTIKGNSRWIYERAHKRAMKFLSVDSAIYDLRTIQEEYPDATIISANFWEL